VKLFLLRWFVHFAGLLDSIIGILSVGLCFTSYKLNIVKKVAIERNKHN
jgi:hypothetical protein